MTIMQQMNLFNTSSEVAGFKLDYLEVWNWGTFDKKVYHMNLHGNNSLLTGANASGKSTLIDALLTLMVPLKRQRFYNQSSGVEKKGNRTEESYFFGNYGNQQQEGAASTTTLRLRDKGARSVLLASFCNVDKRVVTLFQVRYYTGEELKVLFGVARESLTIERDFSEFDLHGDWRKRLTKKYNTNETKRTIEFFDGPVAYGEKMITLFGMRSDKALTLFNQIVGVKVLDDLDSFIRTNMLEELPAEEKYQELKDNFQNLMEAKTNIDKVKEQIAQLEPINALTEELKEIDIRIVEMEQEKSVAAYWFAARTVDLCDKELVCCKSDLRKLEDRLKELKVQKGELEQEQTRLTVAIEKDEVGQQIHEIEKEINQRVRIRDNRKAKAEEYDKLAKLVKMEQSPDVEVFEINRATAKREKDALQVTIDRQLMEEKRQAQNRQDEISSNIEERMATIRYLQQHKNNISGRVAEIRDEILEAVGATTEEIPFIGELICVKDDERDWEYSIERILHNFALRLVVPEKYYKQVNEYVNGHNLRGRIVYQRYQGAETIREFEDRTLKADSLLRKLEYKPMCLYLDWLEDRLFAEFNYSCVDSLADFNHLQEKAVTKEGLIKARGGKHEKDDRPEIRGKEHYVLGWDNKEKIAVLQAEVRQLQQEEKMTAAKVRKLEEDIKNAQKKRETYLTLFSKYDKFDDIDWQSCVLVIQQKQEQKRQLEEANNRVKILQEQLAGVRKEIGLLDDENNEAIKKKTLSENRENKLKERRNESNSALAQIGVVDTDTFESQHTDLLNVALEDLNGKRDTLQHEIDLALQKQRETKSRKNSDLKNLIYRFKNPAEEITMKYHDWRSDVSRLPEAVEFMGEYQAYYQRLLDEDLPGFESRFNKYLQENIINKVSAFNVFFQNWCQSITKTIDQLNSYLIGIDFKDAPKTYIQLVATKRLNVDVKEFQNLLSSAIPNIHEMNSTIDGSKIHFEQHIEPLMSRLQVESWRKSVMDVRGWYTYKSEEFYQDDGQKRNTYEAMGQLSGGEKAQLTYTILGSAIAYQFGLTKSGLDSSFRFIAIDEAFRAQDEDKARYLISLCKQLHLQLLVVTPSDNIHIVENDISYVHYVERKGNCSVLYNMPISEFKAERERSMEV